MTPPKAAKKAAPKKAAKAKGKTAPKPKAAKAPKSGNAAKANSARTAERDERVRRNVDMSGSWPVDPDTGIPLVQISCTASELIPTGEYANVCVGPVTVTKFIHDPGSDEDLADEVNDLCEVIENGCISVQRTLVLESLQDEVES